MTSSTIERPPLYTPAFLTIAAANIFTAACIGMFFMFPLFVSGNGGSKLDIGVIMGAMTLAAVLSRPWVSNIVDRSGRKRMYALGVLIQTGSCLAYLMFKGDISSYYIPLLLLRIAHGVGTAFTFTAGMTYATDIIPPLRLNEGVGMYGAGGLVGFGVGPILGELVIKFLGFPALFVTAALLGGISLLLLVRLPESRPQTRSGEPAPSFMSVLGRPKVWKTSVLGAVFGVGLAAYSNFVPPFAEEIGLSFISLYYFAYALAAITVRMYGGRMGDRIGEKRIAPWAFLVNGLGLLLVTVMSGHGLMILCGLVTGCGHGLLFPSLNALLLRDEAGQVRGRLNGIYTGSIDGGNFLGAILLGAIGELAGFRALFITAGCGLLLGMILFYFWLGGKAGTPK